MLDGKKILAVVPARGGSQGIKLKNLREIGGLSLVARTGKVVSLVPEIDRSVVSTDHEAIAAEAEKFGLAAPFRRPEALSGSRIGDLEVLQHALTTMEVIDAIQYDIILMLQPTSPGRKPQHIRDALDMLISDNADAVWSVSETDSKAHPLKQLKVESDHRLSLYDEAGAKIIARQQLTPLYHRNGVVYAFTRACLMEQGNIMGRNTSAYVMKSDFPNIDTELDLLWAEFLHSHNLADEY